MISSGVNQLKQCPHAKDKKIIQQSLFNQKLYTTQYLCLFVMKPCNHMKPKQTTNIPSMYICAYVGLITYWHIKMFMWKYSL